MRRFDTGDFNTSLYISKWPKPHKMTDKTAALRYIIGLIDRARFPASSGARSCSSSSSVEILGRSSWTSSFLHRSCTLLHGRSRTRTSSFLHRRMKHQPRQVTSYHGAQKCPGSRESNPRVSGGSRIVRTRASRGALEDQAPPRDRGGTEEGAVPRRLHVGVCRRRALLKGRLEISH
jgi:hypothetical protein